MVNQVVFRARLSTGEILEGGDFKTIYNAAMGTAKSEIYHEWFTSIIIELEKGFYSKFYYLNKNRSIGYDFICSEYVGTISMTQYGYAVYSSCGSCYVPCDIRRKSVQSGKEV